eukprot:TRINITY_DN2611_c2_g1_i1.p1 TRINITY_DN2611_c2_g1~~TRINITY_DN2611_c2_g1_i1.p1  ORF type:complete len:459 (-),score=66.51 TRINITY_DN2611_c2_g1_i1:401-1777(-)
MMQIGGQSQSSLFSKRVCASRPSSRRQLCVHAQAQTRDPKQRIVITGMGVVSCFGNEPDHFYQKLLEGTSGVDTISRFDPSEFSVRFAAQIKEFDNEGLIDAKSNRRYDNSLRYSMVSAKKAVEMAGISKQGHPDEYEKLDKTRCGVLVGQGIGGLTIFEDNVIALNQKGYRRISPFFIPYTITNMGSALIAIDQGYMGPNYSISTACATANYAFVSAANHIRNGHADLMVAGGVEAPITPVGLGGFIACRALSSRNEEPQQASRPWDSDRDGFVMGEGAGVLVMESLEHAQNRGANIIAEYLGGALTCDAYHMTDPREDGYGVSKCIELALEDAQADKDRVNYINAHATSTLVGDIAEVKAIKQVFSSMNNIKMNSTKSMIGHGLGAAGGLEAIACIQAIKTGEVHPTINQNQLIDEVSDIDTVPNVKQKLDIDVCISNSFGFGGHNSVVVFSDYKP